MSDKKTAPLKLKALLKRLGIQQAALARKLKISSGTMSDLLNHGHLPARSWISIRQQIIDVLIDKGASIAAIANVFEPRATPNRRQGHTWSKAVGTPLVPTRLNLKALDDGRFAHPSAQRVGTKGVPTLPKQNALRANAERSDSTHPNPAAKPEGEDTMLLRKQTLTPEARRKFNLTRDPFADDVGDAADVFLTADIRYVREAMWATAKHGGLLAVVGESGSGKSTLRRDFADRVVREQAGITIIEPYVLAMEDTDRTGKTLKSMHIAEAIATTINPLVRLQASPEARFKQLHQLLRDSHRSGNRHALVIEEAHSIPNATLKHLKRFYELEDGFKKLLAIILIGQPELRMKLSETNAAVREVVQRCEIAELSPLGNHLEAYLKFKLERAGAKLADVFDKDAIDALRQKLTFASQRGSAKAQTVSLLYPLAVANVVAAAINLTLTIGAPKVSADIIREV